MKTKTGLMIAGAVAGGLFLLSKLLPPPLEGGDYGGVAPTGTGKMLADLGITFEDEDFISGTTGERIDPIDASNLISGGGSPPPTDPTPPPPKDLGSESGQYPDEDLMSDRMLEYLYGDEKLW